MLGAEDPIADRQQRFEPSTTQQARNLLMDLG
jgi:hypothetical protein